MHNFSLHSLLIALSFFFAHPVMAQVTSVDRNDFGSDYPGRIGIVQDAKNKADAKAKYSYLLLPRTGEAKVPKPAQGRSLWLVVNHSIQRDVDEQDEEADDGLEPFYVGVQFISYFRAPLRPSTLVYLYRNKGWIRSGDANFDGGEIGNAFGSRTPADFFAFHDPNNKDCPRPGEICEKQFDKAFMKWHGAVSKDSDNSWEFGSPWVIDKQDQNADRMLVKNYLLKFTPHYYVAGNLLRNSSKPVVFSTEVASLEKIRIRTFAPTFEFSPDLFDNDVTLVFQ
jgi:hypothetical protein